MTVYIEYAFLENFLLDGILLWLSLRLTKTPIRWGWLLLSAALGGVFALLFPLLRLPDILGGICKLSVGLLLPMLTLKIRGKSGWRRYGLLTACFFALTFAFGGALLGGANVFDLSRPSNVGVLVGFALLCAGGLLFGELLYKKRGLHRYIYACEVIVGGNRTKLSGFLDSGNRASKNGVPVCFLSMDIFYELCGKEIIFGGEEGGQVCDEMVVCTLSGERRVPLYKGKIRVKALGEIKEGEVYFAPSSNMIGREYKMIFGAYLLGEGL